MSIKNVIRKVRRMSAAEIIFRITEQIRIQKERFFLEKERKRIDDPGFNFFSKNKPQFFQYYQEDRIQELLELPGMMRSISEPLTEIRKEQFKKDYPAEYKQCLLRADQFLENKFAFLGVKFQLPDPIPWQCDPVSLNPYPKGFYRSINIFTNENAGDVKHVWEVNRLQFIIEIAKAYYLSGGQKYGQKVEKLIIDWDKQNPYKTGIAWSSALEVGVRVQALVWILNFYKAAPNPDNKTLKTLLKLIYLSSVYLHENLSIYFSPYNHLIGETAGLFSAGYLFPGFKNAARYEKESWRIMEDQTGKQFYPDGGLVEQATFYHHFTLGFFLQALAFKKLNGESVPEIFLNRLEKATEFAMFMTKPEGRLPYLGDIDNARSIYFSDPTHWDFNSFQAVGAALFKRADMKYAAGSFKEDAFWILPESDRQLFEALETEPLADGIIQFMDTGYTIFRNKMLFGMMDHGSIAHGVYHDETPSAAHGHADLLAVELSAFGESFLIDPGFSNYRGDFNWHAYFRSTAAHNTIEIDGFSQAKQGGILQWSHAPKFKLLKTVREEWLQGVSAEHYGYERLPGKPVHRRSFLYVDDLFFISIDQVYADSEERAKHQIYYHQHFDKEIYIEKKDNQNRLLAKGKYGNLDLYYFNADSSQLNFYLFKGGDGPDKGWISPTYLDRTPAYVARIGGEFNLPFVLVTLYLPFTGGEPWQVSGQWPEVEIQRNNIKYSLSVKQGGQKAFYLRKYKNGVEESLAFG